MSLTRYSFQEWPQCQKCGAGAQRGSGKGWDPVTRSVHLVCWACKYEYLMNPKDERPASGGSIEQKKAWWRW